jgi:hypothetical protein
MGGNVRVGLEDSVYVGRGEMAKSNADQVRKVRRILDELSLEVATPPDVREMLQLKGRDRVGFRDPAMSLHQAASPDQSVPEQSGVLTRP